MSLAHTRARKGYILFSAVIVVAVLLLVFQATFSNLKLAMAQARNYEVLNQMKYTARTAVMRTLNARASQSGSFPTSDYTYSTTYTQSGNAITVVATVTYKDGTTYKVQADCFLYTDYNLNTRVVIYRWRRIG